MSESKTEPKTIPPTSAISSQAPSTAIEIVVPLDIDRLANAFKKFQEFKSRLLTKDDSLIIAGRQYLKKSAWRKWALACSVSDELLSYERIPAQGKDSEGSFHYRVVVRTFHKSTGRSAIGVAVASKAERKEWAHEEHDIFALCHTRAKNRAIADLVGGGEVSAEEVASGETVKPAEIDAGGPIEVPMLEPSTPQAIEGWQLKVPVVKDPITAEGVKQTPLIDGTRSIGMLTVLSDGSEASLVPEKRIPADSAPVRGFLIPRVLDVMKAKHAEFDYHVDVDEKGMLRAILIRGKLEDPQVKELASASKWAFQRAMESQTPKPQRAGS
jgi:hypothetical protein